MARQLISQPWYADVPRSTRMATLSGVVIVAATVMGFGVWGNTAPIAGAVIATGVFVTTGQNKTIQHLEGGVIREILVREGDVVASGQPLVKLDDTSSRAELRRHELKLFRLEAIEARLRAEVAGRSDFSFPQHLTERRDDPDIATLMAAQRIAFRARQNNIASEIAAPVRGTVVKLRYHTPGGVIEAGKNIMEIVSLQDELIIEARVRPQDIDKIKHSQLATVRLTALNQRTTPMVSGRVIYISADALPDEKQRAYPGVPDLYVVRARLDARSLASVPGFQPTAGMPADVYIQTAERTFFEYLLQPLKDSMARAFRET
jgi:multidrug efflux pump subunit AcrA (membrane-fusion protein)